MIDLHSHLLPGVDDGSQSVEQSLGVLRAMAAEGVTAICLTPHLTASRAAAGVPARHDEAFAALSAALPEGLPALLRGAEIMLDRPLPAEVARDRRACLAGSDVVLVEFPRMITFDAVLRALAHVVSLGLRPLLAHPERYACCTPAAVQRWREIGAVMQVDATTPLQPGSRGARARAILATGGADLVAADNHGDARTLGTLRRALEAQGCAEEAYLLTDANPAALLAGNPLAPVRPVEVKLPLLTRLRGFFEGGGG